MPQKNPKNNNNNNNTHTHSLMPSKCKALSAALNVFKKFYY